VGSLRWREPQPVRRPAGVVSARRFAPVCPQDPAFARVFNAEPQPQSEDCLYLNVWTPAKSPRERLPVMVWIYGGGFQSGAGSLPAYDGAALAHKGVILVTLNYRLGALGFLAHPALTAESPHHASGNYGLLDQIAALKWVRANIAAFGGDPGQVTVFGESAGADSVNYLQASPLAAGLFRGAIGESTSVMDSAAGMLGKRTFAQAEGEGVTFAARLRAPTLEALRAVPAETLVRTGVAFWPIETDGHVLPLTVHDAFATGRQNKVALMVGSNANEVATLPVVWVKPRSPREKAELERLYRGLDDKQLTNDTVAWQMRAWASASVDASDRRAFVYSFEHAQPGTDGRPNPLGAFHTSEIVYAFGALDSSRLPWTSADRRLADLMSSYWTNFAKSGDPNGPGLPPWPAYGGRSEQVMELSDRPHAKPIPRRDALDFIDRYFARRREAPEPMQRMGDRPV
jgi:para-nitrobenzyl esterase